MRPIIALCILYRVHSRLAHLSPNENDSIIIIIVVRRIYTWKRTMIAVVTVSVTVAKPGYNVRGVENKKNIKIKNGAHMYNILCMSSVD